MEVSEGAIKASCDPYYFNWAMSDGQQTLQTCRPELNEVHQQDFIISRLNDRTTQGFDIKNKKGVKYLPNNLFQAFPNLIVVQVFNCSVTTANKNHFKSLSKLKTLSLSRNEIEEIAAEAFADLVSLELLILNYNQILFLDKNLFVSLSMLERLFLENNKIRILHPEIFISLVNMWFINLDKNEILFLDGNTFETLISLKEMSISFNKLETIPKNLFRNNLKLERVWFEGNNIKFIDANMFDSLSDLYYVDLESNVCADKYYDVLKIDEISNDLKQNCSETSN